MFNLFKQVEKTIQTPEVISESAKPTDIRAQWKALAAKKEITKEDMAALCLYRSLIKDQGLEGAVSRLKKSFSPLKNQVKIDNTDHIYGTMFRAIHMAKYSHLAKWITKKELDNLLVLVKATSDLRWKDKF